MWFPGYQYYFNQGVSNAVTIALAASMEKYSFPEAAIRPGIPNPGKTIYADVVTPDILIRPQLPPAPTTLTPYNFNIVMVNPGPGG